MNIVENETVKNEVNRISKIIQKEVMNTDITDDKEFAGLMYGIGSVWMSASAKLVEDKIGFVNKMRDDILAQIGLSNQNLSRQMARKVGEIVDETKEEELLRKIGKLCGDFFYKISEEFSSSTSEDKSLALFLVYTNLLNLLLDASPHPTSVIEILRKVLDSEEQHFQSSI